MTSYGEHTYQWSPTTSLSDSTIANPIASPDSNTTYVLTAISDDNCTVSDTVRDTITININVKLDGELPSHTADSSDFIPDHENPLIFDRFGNTYTAQDLAKGSCTAGWNGAVEDTVVGMFNISMCFDPQMNDPFSPDVVDAITDVFSDLSGLLEHQGCAQNFPLVDIQINAPNTMVNPQAAGASSEFYEPSDEVCTSINNENTGILYGKVWQTINTGRNNPNTIDARIDLNFTNLTFNTNDASGTTGGSEVDLYSVVLHEAFHCLGFATLMSGNGLSRMNPQADFYSSYDLYLHSDTSNEKLIEWDSLYFAEYNPYFGGDPSVLSSGCQNLRFDGDHATYEPIEDYPSGNLSHFGCVNGLPDYMMLAGLGMGDERREPGIEDVNVLLDLGYETTGNFPNTTSLPSGGPGVSGRYDGVYPLTQDCADRYTMSLCGAQNEDTITITAADLLNNDISNNAYDGLEMLGTNGTLINNDTSFLYVPSSPGLTVFRYMPVDSASGERGNITCVSIEVFPCDTNCYQPDVCNQICNPDFDCPQGNCDEFNVSPPPSWQAGHGTADWREFNYSGTPGNPPNPGFARLAAISHPNNWSESILEDVNIQQGETYTISYFRRRGDFSQNVPINLFIRLLNPNPVIPNLNGNHFLPNPLPNNQLIVEENGIIGTNWEEVVVCFTANDDYELLWIHSQIGNANGSVYLDRVQSSMIHIQPVPTKISSAAMPHWEPPPVS